MTPMLDALSPVDGRYRRHTQTLATWLSEQGLIQHRVEVEVEYFLKLVKILPQLADFPQDKVDALRAVHLEFSAQDAQWVKDQERVTNHDVKAVEYFVKDAMDKLGVGAWKEFVHFGLTSQDVNNTAIPLSLKRATEGVVLPLLDEVISDLSRLALEWKDVPMLARTHGQPASPVTLGKELQVFVERLRSQRVGLADAVYAAKFGGATGQFNAHRVAYPEVDWPAFGQAFVEGKLGLTRTPLTTQIEPYDHLAAWCDALRRIHTVILDLDRDVWTYISMDYFKQKIVAGEVGSSAMPHKVNPIDFENSEGNLGVANALLGHFAEKLPVSRLQRDLTDSTVMRNLGVPLGHSVIAMNATRKGLGKLVLNGDKIAADLEANWAIVAEAIQTILRREAYPEPYEALKALTRTNGTINQKVMREFVEGLDVSDAVKAELNAVTPANYLGFASDLVRG
ncbi:MAG: adenylosuccinate lyase [Crocinitomicaceae bacterium]|nr:adenylosuccinate lyase [Crocinitomicaceae bacterium]